MPRKLVACFLSDQEKLPAIATERQTPRLQTKGSPAQSNNPLRARQFCKLRLHQGPESCPACLDCASAVKNTKTKRI